MKPANSFHTARILRAVLAATFAHVTHGVADTLYWDTNGAAPGSGNAGGSWNADNWSASIAGDEATQAWVGGRNAVFSAGTDGTAARTVTISGTIATPSILLKEAGLVTLSGGAIDITGGAVFDTSVLGTAGGRQLTWSSSITGAGPLTLAAHGSTSDSGDNSNSFILLDGLNDFTGDITITSGVVRANSNLGPLTNLVILDGGGIVDPNQNLNFPYDIRIDAGRTGTYRTWGSVSTGQASGALLGAGTLRHTDGGTLNLTGDGSAFTGTINNVRGTVTLTTNDWSGTHFINSDGAALRFNAPGTTTIRSYAGDRDVFIPQGSRLDVGSGGMAVVTGAAVNFFAVQPNVGGGSLTSSSGTLTLDWDTPFTVQATHSISVLVEDFDAATPLTLVKNGPGALSAFNKPNTYSGGTIINGGRVVAQNAQAFGSGKVAVTSAFDTASAGQAWLNLTGSVFANDFEIAGDGPQEVAGMLGAIRFDNNTTVAGAVTLTDDARIVAWNGSVGTISGPLTGSDDLEINFFGNVLANGRFNLTGDLSGFTGDLIVSRGRLHIPDGTVGGGLYVDDGATISGKPTFAGDIEFGWSEGAVILLEDATPGAIHATGDLKLNGVTTVIAEGSGEGPITVMTYGGSLIGDASNLTLPGGMDDSRPGTGFDLTQAGVVSLTVATADLEWTGAAGGEWNLADLNWLNEATPDRFYFGDRVTFRENVPASFTTSLAGDNNDLVFAAVAPGLAGEDISIEFVDAFTPNTPLSVGVTGNAIRVTLQIDGSNVLASTAADVKAAIEASPAASALVAVVLAPGSDGSGFLVEMFPENLTLKGLVSIAPDLAVSPQNTVFDHSDVVNYLLSGPGTLANSPIHKKGSGTLTIGHPTLYTHANALVTGSSSILLEEGTLAFSSRTAVQNGTPIILGGAGTGEAPTILEVPRSSAQDQVVLNAAFALGTLPEGSASEAIIRYTGVSNGGTLTGGAATVQGSLNLNGRDLVLENTSHVSGGMTRLWNFQPLISGNGNVRIRVAAQPNGSTSGAGRVRIQNPGNNWAGDLYLDRGELQIGFVPQVIPDNALTIFAPGTRLTMGGTAETIRGLVGGGSSEAVPFRSELASNTGSANTVRMTLRDGDAANTHVYDGMINNGSPGFMALTKAGAATQVLNGPCGFSGTTLVQEGRLVVNNTYNSTITVSGGATLAGEMTSNAAITATATGARIAPGHPTGTLTAASANLTNGGILEIVIDDATSAKNGMLATTGVLNITNASLTVTSASAAAQPVYLIASYGSLTGTFATTNGIPAGYELVYDHTEGGSPNHIALVRAGADPYLAWLAAYPQITGADRAPDADFDKDGVPNGIEFVLGTDPTSATSTGLVRSEVSGGNLVLTFKRSQASKSYSVRVEHGVNLADWPGVIPIPVSPMVSVPVTVIGNPPDADDVTVTIPMAGDPKKFARILADIPFSP